jgi:two-component system sensor histidine kinase RegB
VVEAAWNEDTIDLSIVDDGPGFAPEIMERIGEPYVTSRRDPDGSDDEQEGLGLGFFIAKTLLERSGASIALENRSAPEHGAAVRLHWNRSDLERSLGAAAT